MTRRRAAPPLSMPTLIARKRDGGALADAEIDAVIDGATKGSIPEYQVAALLMAIVWRGLDARELTTWTRAMIASGDRLRLGAIRGRKVDKHSTGGVGDKISLCLAPLVAACGVPVPMMSGRGLGHTGGTLDKLEAIPGFRTALPPATFRRILARAGLVLAGQSARLVLHLVPFVGREITKTIDVKMPVITAKAQPVVMTIQPAPSALLPLSRTLATTPLPIRMRIRVPMNSPKN